MKNRKVPNLEPRLTIKCLEGYRFIKQKRLLMKVIGLLIIFIISIGSALSCPQDHQLGKPQKDRFHKFLVSGIDVDQPQRTTFEIILKKDLSAEQFRSCFGIKPISVKGKIVAVSMFIDKEAYPISGSNYIAQLGRGLCTKKDETCLE
jgi:hypothetical protein